MSINVSIEEDWETVHADEIKGDVSEDHGAKGCDAPRGTHPRQVRHSKAHNATREYHDMLDAETEDIPLRH